MIIIVKSLDGGFATLALPRDFILFWVLNPLLNLEDPIWAILNLVGIYGKCCLLLCVSCFTGSKATFVYILKILCDFV